MYINIALNQLADERNKLLKEVEKDYHNSYNTNNQITKEPTERDLPNLKIDFSMAFSKLKTKMINLEFSKKEFNDTIYNLGMGIFYKNQKKDSNILNNFTQHVNSVIAEEISAVFGGYAPDDHRITPQEYEDRVNGKIATRPAPPIPTNQQELQKNNPAWEVTNKYLAELQKARYENKSKKLTPRSQENFKQTLEVINKNLPDWIAEIKDFNPGGRELEIYLGYRVKTIFLNLNDEDTNFSFFKTNFVDPNVQGEMRKIFGEKYELQMRLISVSNRNNVANLKKRYKREFRQEMKLNKETFQNEENDSKSKTDPGFPTRNFNETIKNIEKKQDGWIREMMSNDFDKKDISLYLALNVKKEFLKLNYSKNFSVFFGLIEDNLNKKLEDTIGKFYTKIPRLEELNSIKSKTSWQSFMQKVSGKKDLHRR